MDSDWMGRIDGTDEGMREDFGFGLEFGFLRNDDLLLSSAGTSVFLIGLHTPVTFI